MNDKVGKSDKLTYEQSECLNRVKDMILSVSDMLMHDQNLNPFHHRTTFEMSRILDKANKKLNKHFGLNDDY